MPAQRLTLNGGMDYAMDMTNTNITCTGCGTEVEPLDLFPRKRCLGCHAKAFDLAAGLGLRNATASGVSRMWGGR